MNYITFYNTLDYIIKDFTSGRVTQLKSLDAIDRLNEEGVALGLKVSPNVILLSEKTDTIDSNLRDNIIEGINNNDEDDLEDDNCCLDCGVEIGDYGEDYCSSCQQERDDQEEADRLEGLQEEENNRTVTTRRP